MRALLVIDVQKGFVEMGSFQEELDHISMLIHDFTDKNEPVIFIQHKDEAEGPIQWGTEGAQIVEELQPYISREIIIKSTPSAFYESKLVERLNDLGVDEVIITGFNAEYCCLFNSIAAFEHGYKATLVEDAIATVNTSENYGYPRFSIREFIATIADNSGVIQVEDTEDLV